MTRVRNAGAAVGEAGETAPLTPAVFCFFVVPGVTLEAGSGGRFEGSVERRVEESKIIMEARSLKKGQNFSC